MKKKVPVITVAEREEAVRVAELPLEATVALAEVPAPSRRVRSAAAPMSGSS